jgi:5-methylthioadenosine/S-adenosylhomocysteine deaminase
MPGEGTLVRGGWLVTGWGREEAARPLENGALYERDGKIVEVGAYDALRAKYPDVPSVGSADDIVLPGFVNAHSHGRGLTTFQMGQPDEPLDVRVVEMAFRSEWGARDEAARGAAGGYDPYLDTLYACLKQIASGITTTVHSHIYMDGPVESYAEISRKVAKGYADSGMRCAFALGVRDRYAYTYIDDDQFLTRLPNDIRQSAELRPIRYDMSFPDYHRLLRTLAEEFPGIRFQLSPWNPVWCSEPLMEAIAETSRNEGWRVHTHLMETRYQSEYARRTYGKSWIERLHDIGMLTERFSGAHCVWADRADIELLKASGAQIVHNPASNMRLSSGVAPLREFLEAAITVGFGLDSLGMNDDEDLFQDLRLAQLLQNRRGIDATAIPAATMFDMATRAGATVTGIDGIGALVPGNRADAVLLSRSGIEGGVTNQPLAETILRRAKPAHVRTVMIGGKVLIRDGSWVDRDPAQILETLSASVRRTPSKRSRTVQVVKEVVREHLRTYDEDPSDA